MLPAALARAIRLPLLTADQFTPTKWDDGDTKAKFGKYLLRFIAEDFPETLFTKKFYNRLSNTFGHIACHNKDGFWAAFFTHRASIISFLELTIAHPCCGDPGWTYSDVEHVVGGRLQKSRLLNWHHSLLAQERERAERGEYDRLARKFAPESNAPLAQGSSAIIGASKAAIETREPTPDMAAGASASFPPPPFRSPADQPDLFAGM